MKRWIIALVVLILVSLACNNANQTVVNQNNSTTEITWSSVFLTPKTAETNAYNWQEISRYEINDFSIYWNILGYVYWIHSNPPNHNLPNDQVLVLKLNDGNVKYFELKTGKLFMADGK